MESTISIINFNTFDENNSEIKDTSSSQLSLAFIESETKEFNLFSKNKLFESSGDESTDSESSKSIKYKNNSIYKKIRKNSLFKKKVRKDIHGNIIQKGGNYKVSFKDDIKGNCLVEMTFYKAKDTCYKGKNYEKYTIKIGAKDREGQICSSCNIF